MARNYILGTVVGYQTEGSTVNGNPITDVRIDPVNGGAPTIRRVSHDSALTYDVPSHREDGMPRAYVLTASGRVSHEDVYMTRAYARLSQLMPRGRRVATVLTHVSASGMSRRFRLLVADASTHADPRVVDVTLSAARLLGWKTTDAGELVVTGAGMDMGFYAVYTLSSVLHGDGYAIEHDRI